MELYLENAKTILEISLRLRSLPFQINKRLLLTVPVYCTKYPVVIHMILFISSILLMVGTELELLQVNYIRNRRYPIIPRP